MERMEDKEVIAIQYRKISELEEENKKLKSDLSECECSMHFENDEVGYRKRECKKLKEEVRFLEECLDRKEKLNVGYRKENKKLREELSAYDREYFDEDKKAEHIFMEEDTLQELRDIGEI